MSGSHAIADRARQGGCIFMSGTVLTRLYSTTGACKVTSYLFPDHLNLVIEADAVGTDTDRELKGSSSARPAVIVTQNYVWSRYTPAYQEFLKPAAQATIARSMSVAV